MGRVLPVLFNGEDAALYLAGAGSDGVAPVQLKGRQ